MHEPFRSQLAANPGDSTIGLVYADWLSEQGADEESYWRDPRVYAQVWTAICEGFGPSGGRGFGDGLFAGYGDGNGYSLVSEESHGYGDGSHWFYVYGDGFGSGIGSSTDQDAFKEIHEFKEQGFYYAEIVRFEVLMEGRYIFVCDRGFVLVGDASAHPTDWQRVIVNHCATVRQWGTTRGLGQLALEGPQPETILDYEGDGVDVLRATILRAIPCNETAWEKYPDAFIQHED